MAGCKNGDWRLDLSNNQLTSLADEIGELKELAWLDVSNNELTVLSSHIKHLNKLWVLLWGDIQLTTLPDEISELKLQLLSETAF